MKKFITKVSIFTLPFLILFFLKVFLWKKELGDLSRTGYLVQPTTKYYDKFDSISLNNQLFFKISDFDSTKKYDFLTLGDSFSQLDNNSYQNFAALSGLNILHYNNNVNAIETLNQLLNGDFFDIVDIDNIVLEIVERGVTKNITSIDTITKIEVTDFINNAIRYEKNKKQIKSLTKTNKLFSSSTLKFHTTNLLRLLDDNAYFNDVYEVKTNRKLFSVPKNNLYFYREDLEQIVANNKLENINLFNKYLNKLSLKLKKKGIKLYVIIAPNKFSFYYNEISNKEEFVKPSFFEKFDMLKKTYEYIKLNDNFSTSNQIKDFYYYDDTHWSPIGSKFVAKKLVDAIK